MRPTHVPPTRMPIVFMLLASLAAATFLIAEPAMAYVGPGAGISLLGALWGLVVAITMTLGYVVLWPFRRYIFDRRKQHRSDDPDRER